MSNHPGHDGEGQRTAAHLVSIVRGFDRMVAYDDRRAYQDLVAEVEAEQAAIKAQTEAAWKTPEGEVERLTQQTMDTVEARFHTFPSKHQPSSEQWQALTWLARQLSAMAVGHASASRFMLSSLDPGVGKTQTLVAFIRCLLAEPRYDRVGIVVFANRLEELYSPATDDDSAGGLVYECFGEAIEQAKEAGKFAVLTHDDRWNGLGCAPNRGRVLFTTQARLLIGAQRSGSFAAIKELHYRDRPRQVKVWDETILPGHPITLDPDAVLRLVYPIRTKLRRPDLAKALKQDMQELEAWPADELYKIRDYSAEFGIDQEELHSCVEWKSGDQATVTALWLLQGQVGVVRRDDYTEGNTVLSYVENLPDDLMPMLILDASGRCRGTYKGWVEQRRNLLPGPKAVKSYRNLTIHHWNRGGGKASWRKQGNSLIEGIAKMIATKPDEEAWLVVHHKVNLRIGLPNVPKRLREMVPNPERLHFVTWGAHSAVNRFAHIQNVILAGVLFLPEAVYEATTRATIGAKPEDQPGRPEIMNEIIIGEHKHAILQALCRGSVRASKGDACGDCEAWVIGSSQKGITKSLLREVFPDAKVVDWSPEGRVRPKTQHERAADAIMTWFGAQPKPSEAVLSYAEAMRMIGMKDKSNFRTCIRRHPDFQEALRLVGITDDRGFRWMFGTTPSDALAADGLGDQPGEGVDTE